MVSASRSPAHTIGVAQISASRPLADIWSEERAVRSHGRLGFWLDCGATAGSRLRGAPFARTSSSYGEQMSPWKRLVTPFPGPARSRAQRRLMLRPPRPSPSICSPLPLRKPRRRNVKYFPCGHRVKQGLSRVSLTPTGHVLSRSPSLRPPNTNHPRRWEKTESEKRTRPPHPPETALVADALGRKSPQGGSGGRC